MRKLLGIVLLLIILMCSCNSLRRVQEVPVPVETIKTEYINKVEYDSIFVHDSIDRVVNGDSVIIYKEHTKYIYKFLRDTIIQRDTIPTIINTETITEVEVNRLKWYQKLLMWLGVASFLGITVFTTYKVAKLKL